jgi:hypothetical protein
MEREHDDFGQWPALQGPLAVYGERANDRWRIALKTNREIPKSEIPDSSTE